MFAPLATLLALLVPTLGSPLGVRDTGTHAPDRVIAYNAFYKLSNGQYTPLLPIVQSNSEITHLLLFASDVQPQAPQLVLGGAAPDNTTALGPLWSEVAQIRKGGVNVYTSLGGYGALSFIYLEQNFTKYYPLIKGFLQKYQLTGIDLDIEPGGPNDDQLVNGPSSIVRLIKQLRADFGRSFTITLAPVAADMIKSQQTGFSGFSYFDLEQQARYADGTSMIDWYNVQFYSGFGDCDSTDTYDQIIASGWSPSRIVFGVLSDSTEGDGFCNVATLKTVLGKLKSKYPAFGGFGESRTGGAESDAYEWSRAGQSDNLSRAGWFSTLADVIKA